jgi:prolyl-tRNA editing enzyme YbaK/EbsC (Cys-tRNA(Pro) deacylase)
MVLTPSDVQNALDALNLGITIQFFDTPTATSQQAADNIGCELGQIAKSLAFMVDGQPVLVIASGDRRVDSKKLAGLMAVSRKRVKIATPEQCVDYYGYEPGGVPPVGLRTPGIPVYVDDSLQRYEQIYAAAGAHNAIFPILLPRLVEATGGQFADVKREDSQ